MSLLVNLPGKPEDIATATLSHIMKLENGAQGLWQELIGVETPLGDWKSQVNVPLEGGGDGVLDVVYEDDRTILVFEAKLWAHFTDNQPHLYVDWLSRQHAEKKKILVILIPKARLMEVKTSSKMRMDEHFKCPCEWTDTEILVSCNGADVRTVVLTWERLRDCLEKHRFSTRNAGLYSEELCSLVKYQIGLEVPPISQDYLSKVNGATIRNIMLIYRKAFESFKAAHPQEVINPGSRYAGGFAGELHLFYGQGFKTKNGLFWLGLSVGHWADHGQSPIWLHANDAEGKAHLEKNPDCRNETDSGRPYVPVVLPSNKKEEDVIREVVNRLTKLVL